MKLQKPLPVTFQEQAIPPNVRLVGAAAIAHELSIAAPVRRPSCVAEQHVGGSRRREGVWTVFDKRYWSGDSFADHLAFSLKHEDADLLVLKRIFEACATGRSPKGWYAQRAVSTTLRQPDSAFTVATPRW